MAHENTKQNIVDLLKKQSVTDNIVFKGIVYNEGSVAYQYMVDRYTPGNKMILWGNESESSFDIFKSFGSGISVNINETWISVFPGIIDNVGVLFVYPTSPKVDHLVVEKFFEENFSNMFFVEHDINFLGKYTRKVEESKIYTPEKKKQYIEQVLVDSYTIFKNSGWQTVNDYIGNVILKGVNNLRPFMEKMCLKEADEFEKYIKEVITANNAKYLLGTAGFFNKSINEIFSYLNTEVV